MRIFKRWKESVGKIKQELHAFYLACRDPRTPWYAKALGICVIGYALSPIDLIPDPIPVLGYVDDLLLLPLGIAAVRKMIPPAVLAGCRVKAQGASCSPRPKNWVAGGIIIAIWLLALVPAVIWISRRL